MLERKLASSLSVVLWLLVGMDRSLVQIFAPFFSELTSILLYLTLQTFIPTWIILSLTLSYLWYNSLWKDKLLFFCCTWVILALFLIMSFYQFRVAMVGQTTLQFGQAGKLVQITIISSCSGIYGLLIFTSTFFVMIQQTYKKWKIGRNKIIIFGTVGALGVYLINLLRILILIAIELHFHHFLELVHLYLGSLFIIAYLVGYWTTIWSYLPRVVQRENNIQKIG